MSQLYNQICNIRFLTSLLFSTAALILAGCASVPSSIAPRNDVKSFETRKAELKDLKNWSISGGMAVKEGRQGFTASMDWRQYSQSSFSIQLSGPLGSGKIKLVKKGSTATLTDGNKHYFSNNAEKLLQKHTGYYIPVKSLFYWIRGLPAPSTSSSKKFDGYSHLSLLRQQGWTIHYKRFTSFKNFDVPSKLVMLKGNIKVKIVINKWK